MTVEFRQEGPLAVVTLAARADRNRITQDLRLGLVEALRAAGSDTSVRAVVLEGLPDIFCAGGPGERMLGDPHGRVDEVQEMLDAVLNCPVPVVASARGHALGGGFLLALYCDVVVLSARSRYAANFVPFGFTPSLGATYLVPALLGPALGRELLYTGRTYRGQELRDRGAGVLVTAHENVGPEAMRTATYVAQGPRDVLVRLKAQLTRATRASLAAAARSEAADHEETITSAESRRRISTLHGERMGGRRAS
jgi:polyketide biosynthesis enoyl-CoA hydratase PksI